jgi:hypothetical protein
MDFSLLSQNQMTYLFLWQRIWNKKSNHHLKMITENNLEITLVLKAEERNIH